MERISLKQIQKRKDYIFDTEILERELAVIITGNYEGDRFLAKIECGYIDLELNYEYNAYKREKDFQYFCCIKRGESELSWCSFQESEREVNIDFQQPIKKVKKKLEKEMFNALLAIMEKYNFSFDKPNNLE